VGFFLLAPILTVVVFSFNSAKSLSNFAGPSFRWYLTLLANDNLLASVGESVRIALIAAVVATVLGTLLAFGLERAKTPWVKPSNTILLASLITPEIATAVGLFLVFTAGIHLPLSPTTVVLGHITFSLVYVTLVVRTRLAGVRTDVEDAARDLGCTELQTLRLVILPQVLPAIIGGALLVFVLSFDDFITSSFTTGVGTSPLPVYIYGAIKFGLSPEINAIGTLMLLVSLVLGGLGIFLLRPTRGTRRA
jgi:spermidine/putrescine transport system permease protein/putrescine transport system permease protein